MDKREFVDAKVLVIDDEPTKVRLVAELLAIGGYHNIHSQSDSAIAAATFREFQPDLVILDLHMSPIDGFGVLAQIEPSIPAGVYLPILVLTGDISRETRERALSAGAMDFLAKPFNATEIILRVKNLLHTRALYLELERERNLLEHRVEQRTADLVDARNELIERLAMIAEYRDDLTGDHIKRVAQMVSRIAGEMGIPPGDAELMGKASLLHDLGKVAIPDDILLKRGSLSAEEFEKVKTHTEIGGQILKGSKSEILQRAEEIARYHHERWNGTGYQGLSGEEIPLASRIAAVADVYDALTSERPYKEAWKTEAAVAEIERLSGSHFDPTVVEAFMRVVADL